MKNILTRSIILEILLTTLAVTVVLMIVFVISDIAKYLALALEGKLSLANVLLLISLNIPLIASEFLPLSALLGVLLVFGRMAQDSELVILLASGVGFRDIYKMIFKLSLVMAIFLAIISLNIFPMVKHKITAIKRDINTGASLENITAGRFYELSGGNRVIYIKDIVNGEMKDIFLHIIEKDKRHILKAQYGKIELDSKGNKILSLYDGSRYSNTIGSLEYNIIHYQQHSVLLVAKKPSALDQNVKTLSTWQLLGNLGNREVKAELQWRVSIPIMIVVMMIIGVSLSKQDSRAGKFSKILPGVLLFFFYLNFINVSKHKVIAGEMNPDIGLWAVHFVFFAIAAFLVWLSIKSLKTPKNANN